MNEPTPDAPAPDAPRPDARTPRRWSARRIPATLVALVGLAAAAALLAESLTRHDRTTARWRGTLYRALTGHPVDNPWITAVAVLAVVVALALVVTALTPGQRRRLAMATPDRAVRARVDRALVAALLQDRIQRVPGTGRVSVTVGRRRVRVRSRARYGEPELLHDEIERVASAALAGLTLTRPPRLVCRPTLPAATLPVAERS
ncbi:DUF6286 domain-containing protein [Streptacidiphilus cavernicola]|uniref:DUF6286 domain-containing protein n=1 Tax=Streptacidiphilus cavernicola TaxID=3342716 RepID=A0ABV6VZD6_9ACTN